MPAPPISPFRFAAPLLLLAALACSDATGTGDAPGLRAGTYDGTFEVYSALTTPDALVGLHRFTFRVREPAASADDVELVSSRLEPEEGPVVPDYLALDREMLRIEPGEWLIRFPYAEGTYAVSVTLQDLGNGSFRVETSCFGRSGSKSFLGASCLVERR